ncbi:MAG: TonB-dependent receptor [Spongiibacteraceae bacterium]
MKPTKHPQRFAASALPIASALPVAIALISGSAQTHAAESLDTVIVTASKTEQDIQKTAISMQSLSEESLNNAGITNVAEVAKFTPGLQLEKDGGGITATVRIRGIGTPGSSGLDPSVPIFIDGVAQGRTGAGFQDLLDVARVEVLRGPQGTLYGRNSTAGAINVWTKDVNLHNWEGSVQAQLGNFNNQEFKGTVNVPMVDDMLAARISAFSVRQDGYLDNGGRSGTSNGRVDREGGRAKFLLTPIDDVSVQWITDYSEGTVHPGYTLIVVPKNFTNYAAGGIVSQNGMTTLPRDDKYNGTIYSNGEDLSKERNAATSVTVNWDINDDIALTSISAFSRYDIYNARDQDVSILDWGQSFGPATTDAWSQELRLSGYLNDNIEFVSGMYYYGEKVDSYQTNTSLLSDTIAAFNRAGGGLAGRAATGGTSRSISQTDSDAKNTAIFGQLTYDLTDSLSVSAGLRRSWTDKKGNTHLDVFTSAAAVTPAISRDIVDDVRVKETDTSGILKVRYNIEENVMVYASYDRGFKPGGFNRLISVSNLSPSYTKEVSNNYEIGTKTQWFDNRLQVNLTAFYMKFKDYHFQTTDAASNLIIENLPEVTTEGVELDVIGIATDNLTLGFSAAYIDPRVEKLDPNSNTVKQNLLHEDQWLNDASRVTANINAEYVHDLSGNLGEAFARADYGYRSEYLLGDYRDGYSQGGYGLTNFRFGVRKLDTHWQITGWIKNAFDKEYYTTGLSRFANQTDGLSVAQGVPRTYGVTVQYDF